MLSRINPGFAFSATLMEELREFKRKIESSPDYHTLPGAQEGLIQPLQWYPYTDCAYKVIADRKTIRKNPLLTDLHEWLKTHTNNGNLTRQEAVSMVPPVALDVSPHHRVLDMCAAPGSKTTQMLEIITNPRPATAGSASAMEVEGAKKEQEQMPGYVIANDSSTDRAYM